MPSSAPTLHFRIKGSAPHPYEVTAEGAGDQLRIFCRCPAGDRGGMFCKHIAALLMGDVSNVTEGVELVPELRARADGTHWVEQALAHTPSRRSQRIEGVASLEDVLSLCEERFGGRCGVMYRDDDAPSVVLLKFSPKTGKPLRKPFCSIEYREFTYDLQFLDDGTIEPYNIRKSTRPWSISAQGVRARSFGDVGAAVYAMLEAAETALVE